ncbi:MAG TPA: hypothetical protein PLO64_07125 [Methanothermobacter sp.]|nr:conserved hypothetical protein [Methanothermobacter sp. MT-2]HHW05205.1 hypothetical protein [Methanothermobacter sp.]HOK72779.1 hypothetical protein [Methanothermobacter sp.]HOL69685.1 hypothetical protein [Methanothermobacter sp.]HPQ05243.1 hypothetical protein [Methanothermobacter sp.]
MTKVKAKTNLDKKVAKVDSHISLVVCLSSASSETWIPSASERASATAIVNIPPITTNFECVPEFKPTIKPKVVITAEVKPKLNPVLNECLIITKKTYLTPGL